MNKQKTESDGLASFKPTLSIPEITTEFVNVERAKLKNQGANDCLNDFLLVAQMIATQYRNFSFNDFLTLSRHLNTPASALAYYYHEWIAAMEKVGRVRTVHGCFDYPVHSWH
jgi:hypothetical protein